MPRPKVTVKQHTETVNKLTKTIAELQIKVEQRDRLVKLMQEDHNRTLAVSNDIRNKASAIIAQVETFHQNWTAFKKAAIDTSFAEIETNNKSEISNIQVKQAFNETYFSNSVGPAKMARAN